MLSPHQARTHTDMRRVALSFLQGGDNIAFQTPEGPFSPCTRLFCRQARTHPAHPASAPAVPSAVGTWVLETVP